MNELDENINQTMEEIGTEEAMALLEQNKVTKVAGTISSTAPVTTGPSVATTVATSLKCKFKGRHTLQELKDYTIPLFME